MFQKTATTMIVTACLLVGSSILVKAQTDVNIYPDGSMNSDGSTAVVNDTSSGFNWWWLLPIIAIPLLYLLMRESNGSTRTRYTDRGLAGTKGGQTTTDDWKENIRRNDEDEVDEEV